MAKMRVVLRERVEKLGDAGDVCTVAGGYARNFLIPRGLAVPATKGNLAQAEAWRRQRHQRIARELQAAEEVRRKLESAPLLISAQAGPDGRLFGSVTASDVAQAAAAAHGVEIDRHLIQLEEPIRHLGFHEVAVRLHPQVTARLTLEVVEK